MFYIRFDNNVYVVKDAVNLYTTKPAIVIPNTVEFLFPTDEKAAEVFNDLCNTMAFGKTYMDLSGKAFGTELIY